MSLPLPDTLRADLSTRAARWLLCALAAVWLALLGGDWLMRLRWFRWHESLVLRPRAQGAFLGPEAPLRIVELPARRGGGDLTQLIALPEAARRFEEERPAATDYTDEFGFRNRPPTAGRAFDVVVAGDSFMAQGEQIGSTPAGNLAALGGWSTYTYAYPGRGPIYAIARFFEEERFRLHPPRVLLWGLVEREIGGDVLGALPWYLEHGSAVAQPGQARLNTYELKPRQLKRTLPNTSVVAQAARKIWNILRYHVLGQLTPEVAVSRQPIDGREVLFYTPALTAMRWTPAQRKPEQMADVIAQVAGRCAQRGIALIPVLIPDKEQVYREYLPARLAQPPVPRSTLLDLEDGLRARGLRAVNLLDPYRRAAAAGRLLYRADDTHWNEDGIALAAAEIQRVLAGRFDTPAAAPHSDSP